MRCDYCQRECDSLTEVRAGWESKGACDACLNDLSELRWVEQCQNCGRWFDYYYLTDGYCQDCVHCLSRK